MEVKCKCCGKKIDRDTAFKFVTYSKNGKKQNNYYHSEEEYNNMMEEKQYKYDFYEAILPYFAGMKSTGSLPKILFSEMLGVAEQYSWKDIYEYLLDDKEYLDQCMDKDFVSDWARGKYLVAVFRNNVGKDLSWRGGKAKVVESVVKEPPEQEVWEVKRKEKKTERVGFSDMI